MLDHTPIRPEQIHSMPVESPDLETAARQYASTTARNRWFAADASTSFTWALRPDGHTASLLTGDPAIGVDEDVALTGVYQGRRRMTLTYPVINRARRLLWMVTGREKAGITSDRLYNGDLTIPSGQDLPGASDHCCR